MGEFFKWEYVFSLFPKVLSALPTTLLIVLFATIIGSVLGILIAYIRIENIPILKQICILYVSFIRGTPILVQMFIVFYGLPNLLALIGIDLSQWNKIYFIYITYGLNTAAFFSEIFRSSLLSVPVSQYEAAASIGLTKRQTYQRILIPQARAFAIPNLGASIINLLQDTSLAFSIGILDVMGKVQALGALYYRVIEGYFIAAIIFIVLSILLEKVFNILEIKYRYPSRSKKKLTGFLFTVNKNKPLLLTNEKNKSN
ncbi:amino acid ABC transporter permease [Niallia sp. 01092]|uniref:amino acid ABC transporter permease n=1 Tax=unclassified Niallia TaxID=2837522 RepID=UPI003FD079B8